MSAAERISTFRDVAGIIREPVRLGWHRTRGSTSIGRYHLRGSGLVIHLRHDVLDDVATLIQTFRQDHYVLPPAAAAALDGLGRPVHAMDLGANIGMFGAWFLSRFPDGRVSAYEAEPSNARVHALTVDANRPAVTWEVTAAAAAPADGEVRFVTGLATHSRLARADDAGVTVVPARDVLARAGDVDLLKVDIEGAEWALLADPRFADLPAPVIALEYHAERCPEPDPRVTAWRALERAGYDVAGAELVAPPGHGMLWAWRP